MIDIKRYNKVVKPDILYQSVKVKTHAPSPTDIDYKRGYLKRFFVQKANDTESAIYEVDFMGFSKVIDNPFFAKADINWRIKGTDEQIKNSNSKAILLISNKIPKIGLYLPNLLQFKEKKDLELP